jgi:hypothetical protein
MGLPGFFSVADEILDPTAVSPARMFAASMGGILFYANCAKP